MEMFSRDKIEGDKVTGNKIVNNYHFADLGNRLKKIQSYLQEFMPKTALTHIIDLEESIPIVGDIELSYSAKILILKGMCFYEMGDVINGQDAYLKAWAKCPEDYSCIEKSIQVSVERGQFELAEELINSFNHQSNNPVLWAAKVFIDTNDFEENLKKLPVQIRSISEVYRDFQLQLARFCIRNSQEKYLSIIFKEEIKNGITLPESIGFNNYRYWLLLANLLIAEIVTQYSFSPDCVHPEIRENNSLKMAVLVMERIFRMIDGTEQENFIDHYKFWYAYGQYCLSETEEDANRLEQIYNNSMVNKDSSYSTIIAFVLCQKRKYEKVLLLPDDAPQVIMAKGHASLFSGNLFQAKSYFKSYFNVIESFKDGDLGIFIGLQNEIVESEQERIENWEQYQNKIIDPTANKLAELFSLWEQFNPEEIKEKIDDLRTSVNVNNRSLTVFMIGNAYFKNKNFTESLQIFSYHINFDVESAEHFRYIETLIASHHDDTELLDRLENWRLKGFFMPSPFFLKKEIELLQLIPDWRQISEVANEGIKLFPSDLIFYLYKIWSLEQSGEDILPILNPFIGNENLPVEFVSKIAQSAFNLGLLRESVAILYPYADKPSGYINIREMYFFFFTFLENEEQYGRLNVVTKDCWVEVDTGEGHQWLQITPENSSVEPYKTLVDKNEGEVFQIPKPQTGVIKFYKIIQVGDKYYRLFKLIYEEVAKNGLGYSIESILFPKVDVESINQFLMEKFGEQEEEKREIFDKTFERYNLGHLSFTQVVKTNGGDPVKAYDWLTGSWGKNFWLIPKKLYGVYDLSKLPPDVNYVLDFTSVLLFFKLSKERQIRFPSKFLVSPFLVEILKIELLRIKRQKAPAMSLLISRQNVKPFLYPDNYQEIQAFYYQDLLDWIESNCITHPNRQKLKVIGEALRNSPELARSVVEDSWLRYCLDTIFMTYLPEMSTILISDDSLFKVSFSESNNQISSEMYLSAFFSHEEYEDKILPHLLENNYRNLSITKDAMEKEFQKFLRGESSNYLACVNNLFANSTLLSAHLKSLYSTSTKLLDQKRQLSQQAIRAFTNGVNLSEESYQSFVTLLRHDFRFLPNFVSYVLEDLSIVCHRGIDWRSFLGHLTWK